MRIIRGFVCLLLFLSCALTAAESRAPDTTVMIPMRDGTQLPADIYFPKEGSEKTSPCILMRSPGGRKAASAVAFTYLADLGYTVAIQDTRSALDSAGKTMPYWNDGWGNHKDGYDTVEWLAKSPYSNGKIGTVGASALGITQLLMAPTAPPALKCQYIGMASASVYHDAIYPGGQLLKSQVEGWLGLYAKDPDLRHYVCSQDTYNKFWSYFDTTQMAGQVKVPAIHYGGWFDTFLQGTLDSYMARQDRGGEGAKGKQKLIIGPWIHFWPTVMKVGDFTLPKHAEQPPIDVSPQRWFDFNLKEIANGIDTIPNVIYYVMGPFDGTPSSGNVWRFADKWPVPSKATNFYLTAERALSETQTDQPQTTISYTYNPANPVPTIGGRNLFLESGAKDQRTIEQRDDVITFTSQPLAEDLEVTGQVLAKVYFSSDQPETDVAIRLTDVYPDGRSILIADGLTHFISDKTMLNQPQEVSLDLWSTSIVFAKGHRIRISISSSNYPRFEICKGKTATVPVKNTLYIDGRTPSHLILPIVR